MHIFLHSSRHQLFVLLLLWLSIQIFAYYHFGIGSGCDTDFYISIGERICKGVWPEGREIYYASYSAVFAVFHSLGLAYKHIVWLQLLCAGLSMICLYQLAHHVFKNLPSAFISCILYITWIKIHQWNFFLYTESLYTSFSIILIWLLLVRSSKPLWIGFFFLCLVWTFMLRPSSVCLLFGLALYMLIDIYNTKKRWFWQSIVIAAFGGLLGLNHMLQNYELLESYRKAEIIYPNVGLWLQVPTNLVVLKTSYPLWDLLVFIVHNPLYFTKLFLLKLILFYANVKPYFSWTHNCFVVVFLWPMYYWAWRTLYSSFVKKEILVLVTIILFQGLIVGLTTENWDGRFLIPILPFVFVLASRAMARFMALEGKNHV